jgi:hypothetical protein
MASLALYSPHDLNSESQPSLGQFGWRFLAEGDSWFTIGSLNPAKNSNLLFELEFDRSACAVNCAYPGDELQQMVKMNADRMFRRQLVGNSARLWDGILLSAGGNDLIAALKWHGPGIQPSQRLLLKPDEWGDASLGPARYLSEDGWTTFGRYFKANLAHLLALRDAGPNKNVPVFMHGYALPTPRPSGAGLGAGPWIWPAVNAVQVPAADHMALAALLIQRLAALIAACAADPVAYPALHFFDSTQVPITPAEPGSTGESGDWVNEIHLTWRGYEKIGKPWGAAIEAVLLGG